MLAATAATETSEMWLSAKQIADLSGVSVATVRREARRTEWEARKRSARGGGSEYRASSLPSKFQHFLASSEPESNQIRPSQRQPRYRQGNNQQRIKAKINIHQALSNYQEDLLLDKPDVTLTKIYKSFVEAYNARDPRLIRYFGEESSLLHAYQWRKTLSVSTLRADRQRLQETSNFNYVGGGRYGNRDGSGAIESNPELEEKLKAIFANSNCYCSIDGAIAILAEYFDSEQLPTYWQVFHWRRKWRRSREFKTLQDPKATRSKFAPAYGRCDDRFEQVGDRVEMDGTPINLQVTKVDSQTGEIVLVRRTLTLAIDVASRYLEILVTDAPSEKATLELMRHVFTSSPIGIPREIATDRGSEFGDRVARFLANLGVKLIQGPPGEPTLRPFVERVNQFQNVLMGLPGWIGRNVSERQNLRGNPLNCEEPTEQHLTVEELDALLAEARDAYNNAPHKGLGGKTPNEAIAESVASGFRAKTVADPRQLDWLAMEGDWRVPRSEGIQIDHQFYLPTDERTERRFSDLRGQTDISGESTRVWCCWDKSNPSIVYVYDSPDLEEFIGTIELMQGGKRAAAADRAHQLEAEQRQAIEQIYNSSREVRADLAADPTIPIRNRRRTGRVRRRDTSVEVPREPHTTDALNTVARAMDGDNSDPPPPPLTDEQIAEIETYKAERERERNTPTLESPFERAYRICAFVARQVGDRPSLDDLQWMLRMLEFPQYESIAESFDLDADAIAAASASYEPEKGGTG